MFFPRKGHFLLIFSVSLSFSLSFFGPPSSSVSLSLSLSFLLFFLSSFLSFLFAFFLVPCFCLFLSFSFFFACVSWKDQHKNIKLQVLSSSIFSLFLVSCLFFQVPFSYLCYSLILSYVFCSTSWFFISKQTTLKKKFLGQKGGCNKTGFLSTCVLQNVKSYRFFCVPFWGKFRLMFEKHYKNWYFSTF